MTTPRPLIRLRRRMYRLLRRTASRIGRRIGSVVRGPHAIYWPTILDADTLTNHYYRACWYLPRIPNAVETVTIVTLGEIAIGPKPECMGDVDAKSDHVTISTSRTDLLRGILRARVVLCWKRPGFLMRIFLRTTGASVAKVATNDPTATEYGSYARAAWTAMPPGDQQAILDRSRGIMTEVLMELRSQEFHQAVVLATGPSLELAKYFDIAKCVRIACNSVVQDSKLLAKLRPHFLTAGDVVSHLGVSQYADKWRRDLAVLLRKSNATFVTTAPFGFLLSTHYPDIADQVVLISQAYKQGPVLDMTQNFCLPTLDSTLNIHMLPIASTLADEIYLFGCDGQNPINERNEDFWAHSPRAQYHDLVESAHRCHPTFDPKRQANTLDRYCASTAESIGAIRNCGKFIAVVGTSFTPGLAAICLESTPDSSLPSIRRCRGSDYKPGKGSNQESISFDPLHDEQVTIKLEGGSNILVHHHVPVTSGVTIHAVMQLIYQGSGPLQVALERHGTAQREGHAVTINSSREVQTIRLCHQFSEPHRSVRLRLTNRGNSACQVLVSTLLMCRPPDHDTQHIALEPIGQCGPVVILPNNAALSEPSSSFGYPVTFDLGPDNVWIGILKQPIRSTEKVTVTIDLDWKVVAARVAVAFERHGRSPREGMACTHIVKSGRARIVLSCRFKHDHAACRLRIKNTGENQTAGVLRSCRVRIWAATPEN